MGEPKKFSFGFSKVVKKPSLIPSKAAETEQVEYIKCVEDKTVKLVNEEANKPKPLPVIPMPPGSSVKDRILEAIKAREEAKSGSRGKGKVEENGSKVGVEKNDNATLANESGENVKHANNQTPNGSDTKPLTLDEMAAKELLESAKMDTTEEKKPDLVITGTTDDAAKKESTLDDYEEMPIGDFGLAMLRGMGWDPKKGIGLNEKVVAPTAPQVRPKGMGLGADKALAAQNPQSKAAEELVMKKGSLLKVIAGPHAGLYGKIEGFEELPGRLAVRLALSNSLVSLNEFMVQLVGPTEYNKNAKVMNLDKYNAALDPESKPLIDNVKSEPKHRPASPPVSRRRRSRSRSPSDYREKSSSYSKPKKRDQSRDRTSSFKKVARRSDSSDSDDYRKKKEERRPHKSSKKSKYRSDSSDSNHKSKKKSSRDKDRTKYSKNKSYKSGSDSDSNGRHHKKHKKSKKNID